MSDTPRTAQKAEEIEEAMELRPDLTIAIYMWEQFSCQLERELSETKAMLEQAERHLYEPRAAGPGEAVKDRRAVVVDHELLVRLMDWFGEFQKAPALPDRINIDELLRNEPKF